MLKWLVGSILGSIVLFQFTFPHIIDWRVLYEIVHPKVRSERIGNCVFMIDRDSGATINKECGTPEPKTAAKPLPSTPQTPSNRRCGTFAGEGWALSTEDAERQARMAVRTSAREKLNADRLQEGEGRQVCRSNPGNALPYACILQLKICAAD
jgi:hypothetical protein